MRINGTKGIMGIGTLIIFIATILVAAVAAAVLISTSNVLQQRSLLVGQEARKAITDSVEVVSILAASDATEETFNNFEILVRLSPGSDPLQMRKFNLQYISPSFDKGADLYYDENETQIQVGLINTTANTTIFDLDEDGTAETATIVANAYNTYEGLKVYLSSQDNWSDTINLGVDLSSAGTTPVNITLDQTPITYNETNYGFIEIDGQTEIDDAINESVNVSVVLAPSTCSFSTLNPESSYCYVVVNGNDDNVLGSGERFKLLYKVKDSHVLNIGEDFQFIFTSEKGRLSEARARTPDVVTSTKVKLWPLG